MNSILRTHFYFCCLPKESATMKQKKGPNEMLTNWYSHSRWDSLLSEKIILKLLTSYQRVSRFLNTTFEASVPWSVYKLYIQPISHYIILPPPHIHTQCPSHIGLLTSPLHFPKHTHTLSLFLNSALFFALPAPCIGISSPIPRFPTLNQYAILESVYCQLDLGLKPTY